jgi:amidase
MVWLANGSDLGGSLRIPASFCSVVGFRPSPGVVAHGPGPGAFDDLAVSGPMARNVADLELLLEAMSGQDARDPLSIPFPPSTAREKLRVGWSADLGFLPVDPEVKAICAAAARRFGELGAAVEEGGPDFSGARETFQTLRALRFASAKKDLLERHRAQLKPEVIWNIEQGLKLTADEIGRAFRERVALYQRVAAFFQTHDLLVSPVVMVPPFPVERRWVEECAGVRFDNYVDWLGHTFAVTLTRCPAISLPCGFTRSGLPVGLQIVAPPMHDAALLHAARRLEPVLGIAARVPHTPRAQ